MGHAARGTHGVVGAEDEAAAETHEVWILEDGLDAVLAHDAVARFGDDDVHAVGGQL